MQNCLPSLGVMIDIKELLRTTANLLAKTSDSAKIDAEILLAHVLNKTRAFLYSHPEKNLSKEELESFKTLIDKRAQGHPIAYLIGRRDFWSISLSVNEDVLIPRPETERLVDLTLNHLFDKDKALILDLGTGSGAIALALASERPNWQIIAADVNEKSAKMAQKNATDLGLENVQIIISDWFKSISNMTFNAIVANPPYISEDDPHLLVGDLRFEPKSALISKSNGLKDLTEIIKDSYDHLLPGGILLVEHGYMQKNAVLNLFHQYGYENIKCFKDLEGNDRVSCGLKKYAAISDAPSSQIQDTPSSRTQDTPSSRTQ